MICFTCSFLFVSFPENGHPMDGQRNGDERQPHSIAEFHTHEQCCKLVSGHVCMHIATRHCIVRPLGSGHQLTQHLFDLVNMNVASLGLSLMLIECILFQSTLTLSANIGFQ